MKKKKKFNLQRHLRQKAKYEAFLERQAQGQFQTALDKDREPKKEAGDD